MFRRVFLSALVAGVLGGLAISVVQTVTTTPLILHAETFENAAPLAAAAHAHDGHAGHAHDHAVAASAEAWAPKDGAERLFYTVMTNILAGFGFALLISGGFALAGRRVDAVTGVLWGIGGFAAFALAPGLGLPPELPGTAAGDLVARQGWWGLAAAATVLGLSFIVFRGGVVAVALGLFAIALPHAIGAPHPATLTNAVPPELAAQFATASIGTSAVFWLLLGWLAGKTYERLGAADTTRAFAIAAK